MVTAQPQSDPEPNAAAGLDLSSSQSSDHSKVPLSPVIVVTRQSDVPPTEEASPSEEIHEDLRPGTDTPSTTDSVSSESGTPDASTVPESANPTPGSPEPSTCTLSSPQSTDVAAKCAQSDQSATHENPATSDQISEDALTVQPSCPSPPLQPCTESPTKISLESLNQAIGCDATAPYVMQTMAQGTTDRAVYLTGEIKASWEVERSKEEKQREAEAGEKAEGRVDDEEKGIELEDRKDEQQEAEVDGEGKEEEEVEEELPQSTQPMESQTEGSAGLHLDSVAIIRDLVTEVIEVETVVSPCPDSSSTL